MNTLKLWIKKAQEVHGERYDYSNSVFTKYDEPISFVCKECGETLTIAEASTHINKEQRGCHCVEQGVERADKTVSMLEVVGEKHNHKYSYVASEFKNVGFKLTITCPYHGNFNLKYSSHRDGSGCPVCQSNTRFEDDMVNNLLDIPDGYSLVTYNRDRIWLKHEDCGTTFSLTAKRPLSSLKMFCQKCYQRVTFEVFKERANEVHGDSYEYSDFVSIGEPLTMTHKICGNTFKQDAGTHLSGNYGKGVGCPYCATYGFSVGRPAYIYVLHNPAKFYTKVGITHQEVVGRIRQISKSTGKLGWRFEEMDSWSVTVEVAKKVEKFAHETMRRAYEKPTEKFDGSGETYLCDPDEAVNLVKNYLGGAPLGM